MPLRRRKREDLSGSLAGRSVHIDPYRDRHQEPFIAAVVLVIGVVSLPASADTPGADWMSKEQVTQKLEGMVTPTCASWRPTKGHWEGNATKAGVSYKIHVDPHSGELTKK